MLTQIKNYVITKVTHMAVGRLVKWGFWSAVLFAPVTVVSTVGLPVLTITAITVHSGLIEYTTTKLIYSSAK